MHEESGACKLVLVGELHVARGKCADVPQDVVITIGMECDRPAVLAPLLIRLRDRCAFRCSVGGAPRLKPREERNGGRRQGGGVAMHRVAHLPDKPRVSSAALIGLGWC